MNTLAVRHETETQKWNRRSDYADERRGAQENSLAPGDQVLVRQRKENKLSTTFEDAPYKVTNKHGNEVTVTSPEGVNYKRNATEVKWRQAMDQTNKARKTVSHVELPKQRFQSYPWG